MALSASANPVMLDEDEGDAVGATISRHFIAQQRNAVAVGFFSQLLHSVRGGGSASSVVDCFCCIVCFLAPRRVSCCFLLFPRNDETSGETRGSGGGDKKNNTNV